jgi:hypothetical protein
MLLFLPGLLGLRQIVISRLNIRHHLSGSPALNISRTRRKRFGETCCLQRLKGWKHTGCESGLLDSSKPDPTLIRYKELFRVLL